MQFKYWEFKLLSTVLLLLMMLVFYHYQWFSKYDLWGQRHHHHLEICSEKQNLWFHLRPTESVILGWSQVMGVLNGSPGDSYTCQILRITNLGLFNCGEILEFSDELKNRCIALISHQLKQTAYWGNRIC